MLEFNNFVFLLLLTCANKGPTESPRTSEVEEVQQRRVDQSKITKGMHQREANVAKNLRYCRERDRTQYKMNKILYETTPSREMDKLDKTGLLSKLQCMKAANSLGVWDKGWRRRGEMKLEEKVCNCME